MLKKKSNDNFWQISLGFIHFEYFQKQDPNIKIHRTKVGKLI